MKRMLLASLVVPMLLGAEARAETVFRGTSIVTAVTPACQGTTVNRQEQTTFHPLVAGNDDFTGLNFYGTHSAYGYELAGPFTAAFQVVEGGGVGWSPYDWSGSQIRIIAQTPPAIVASTRFVTLRGQIKKPRNDAGGLACIVTFEASYTRQPP